MPLYTIFILLYLFALSGFVKNINCYEYFSSAKYEEVIDDLPRKNELDFYLTRLEKIVNFATDHKYYADIHISFGLFLLNVNLRKITNSIFTRLPDDIKDRLDKLLQASDDILSYYQEMVDTTPRISPEETPEIFISGLFYKSEHNWGNHLVSYKPNLLMITTFYTSEELESLYSDWVEYVDKVFAVENVLPHPEQAVTCLAQLDKDGHLGLNYDVHGARCMSELNRCTDMVLNGTNYGYAMIHRLLYVIMGRFGRGCAYITESLDRHVIDALCKEMYNEAEYIAQHESRIPYLVMGQISLCSLEGHFQFVRRSWINPVLEYQTESGCFGRAKRDEHYKKPNPKRSYYRKEPEWQIHVSGPILNEKCNTPTTGVATSMLAATIRLLLERFYRYENKFENI